ncbi:alpha/beta hydrolase [Microbacteriaceae bacterium VKM Ac-2854]|nr:alpha/beta hydrolase [Microbacteriaceae bacterium VKM Ac-2854]
MYEFTLRRDDVTIAGLDSGGDGPAVVLLHGLAGSSRELVATAEALPDHRRILVDLRGHGGSTRLPGDVSRAAFVADVVHVIEQLAGAPLALVGQSMGAHTAMLVAAARPDLVDRLVLLEGGPGGGTREKNAEMGEWFASWPVPFADLAAAGAFLGDGALGRAWLADLEPADGGWRPRFDAATMVRIIDEVIEPRWKEWAEVAAPTLVVYAAESMFTPQEQEEFVRRGRDVRRVDLGSGTHDAHLDATAEWIAVLREFLG